MARLSDIIETFIKELMEKNTESELEIQRNELASYFSCAPSQINYVLATRFTSDKGYYVEGRRGGGGCIIIRKIEFDHHKALAEAINDKIGDSITYDRGVQIIYGLRETGIISPREAEVMKIATNDRTLSAALEMRNKLRADLLRSMIMILLML